MIFEFFEGAAGTGKTHNLVVRAAELTLQGALAENRRLLALTFMNGARRRLLFRLGQNAAFGRRFECQTFDVFARTLSTRRRSLLVGNTEALRCSAALNEFDGPCFLAATLLRDAVIQRWVAASFPLVIVDEAQDLDDYRMGILHGLSQHSRILAAADGFQCLTDGRDTAGVMSWLEAAGQTHRLTEARRTSKGGLLAAALAVREGRDLKTVLTRSEFGERAVWNGHGFRLIDVPAKKPLVAWAISNELSQRTGQVVVLTPDSKNAVLRGALELVSTKEWRRKNGSTFGPFPLTWELHDFEAADAFLKDLLLPEVASASSFRVALAPVSMHAPVLQAIARLDRLRRVRGQTSFTAIEVAQFVREAVRNQSRHGFRQYRGNLAMTIQRAKNREFDNVVVLWPHSATGRPEQLRRLLYNGLTRAIKHCSVIVFGQDRLDAPPFAGS